MKHRRPKPLSARTLGLLLWVLGMVCIIGGFGYGSIALEIVGLLMIVMAVATLLEHHTIGLVAIIAIGGVAIAAGQVLRGLTLLGLVLGGWWYSKREIARIRREIERTGKIPEEWRDDE
jgi:hypothetical protein